MQPATTPSAATKPRIPVWLIVLQVALWLGVLTLSVFAVLMAAGKLGGVRSDPGISRVFAIILGVWAGTGGVTLLLGLRWRWVLIVPGLLIGMPMAGGLFAGANLLRREFSFHLFQRGWHAGKNDFSDQPALLAVANAISHNDENALRAAASKVPDLQARGQGGRTLLEFAVDEAVERPELVTAVKTLLALGADPNFPGGHGSDQPSVALFRAVNGNNELLRAMLDAGGDPNAHDAQDRPLIFAVWEYIYNAADRPAQLDLLLDYGANIEAALPANVSYQAGYTLLLWRAASGLGSPAGYVDALHLLERGADYHFRASDDFTLAAVLAKHRRYYLDGNLPLPTEYEALCAWLQAHGETVEAGAAK